MTQTHCLAAVVQDLFICSLRREAVVLLICTLNTAELFCPTEVPLQTCRLKAICSVKNLLPNFALRTALLDVFPVPDIKWTQTWALGLSDNLFFLSFSLPLALFAVSWVSHILFEFLFPIHSLLCKAVRPFPQSWRTADRWEVYQLNVPVASKWKTLGESVSLV